MPSSGVGGPCNHCNRTSSCCWRRGPPSKPVLCNACGSRYLVKRSLDGYQPLQTRRENSGKPDAGGATDPAPARRPAPAPAAGRAAKPKRAAQKRPSDDSDWSSDVESEVSVGGGSDDSGASQGATAGRPRRQQHARRSASPAKAPKLTTSYITSHAQLKDIDAHVDFGEIAGAFFASSLRLKPRKPVVVTVSAVW